MNTRLLFLIPFLFLPIDSWIPVSAAAESITGTVVDDASSPIQSSEQATWKAFLNDPALNVVDELGTYDEDLSAYGTPRPAPSIKAAQSTSSTDLKPGVNAVRIKTVGIDEAILRAYFHNAALHPVDGLSDYGDDLSGSAQPAHTVEEAVALHLQLGTEGGGLKIIPSALALKAGKPYKLVITNPSNVAHVLAMPEFVATVEHSSSPAFSYKPAEIDVVAGETVEWYFIPAKAGRYKMGCALQDHADAGMRSWIVVS